VDEVHQRLARRVRRVGREHRHRRVAQPHVFAQRRAVAVVLAQQVPGLVLHKRELIEMFDCAPGARHSG
jgi:hypothetical protein